MSSLPRGALALCLLMCASCLDNPGIAPPARELNFPIAGRLWPAGSPTHLIVANSNFDLRYNAGTLQTWALAPLEGCLEQCRAAGTPGEDCFLRDSTQIGGDEVACPGLFGSEVRVDSFAAGVGVSPDGERVYVPVRSDDKLFRVEIGPGAALSCGAGSGCDGEHRDVDAGEELSLPADPVGIYVGSAASDLGTSGDDDYVVLSHRQGATSLLSAPPGARPSLLDVADGFTPDLASVSRDPRTGLLWIPSATRPFVTRIGVAMGSEATLSTGRVYDAGVLRLRGVDTGASGFADARQVVFDPRGIRRAYILSRRPRALFVVSPDDSLDSLSIEAQVDVGAGPSRLVVQELRAGTPQARTLAIVSCFDSRDVYLVDVDAERLAAVFRGVSGPFDLAVDAATERLYITDFRASVIRVVDLAPTLDCLADLASGECTPQQLGMIGRPRAIVELR